MAALPSVTRAAVDEGVRTGTPAHRVSLLLCALCILVAGTIAAPTSAQTRLPGETADAPRPDRKTAPATASVERIRRALALHGPTQVPDLDGLDLVDERTLVDVRSPIQLAPGFTFLAGMDPFSFMDPTAGPVPLGGPTHRAMMSVMTPRAYREAQGSDVLGIATSSAFALVPYAIKGIQAIANWLFGDAADDGPEHPVLTESEETAALARLRIDDRVLDANVHQRGRTVGLSLVVSADTSSDTARALGEHFVMLVKTLASTEPNPPNLDAEIGAGNYDYIVRVSSPTRTVIALGGKATTHTRINW